MSPNYSDGELWAVNEMAKLRDRIHLLEQQRDDLLAACKAMLRQHGTIYDALLDKHVQCICYACEDARAAIRKARGQ